MTLKEKEKPKTLLKLTDKIKFGKYEGFTIERIIEIDYEFIRNCFDTIKTFALDRNARLAFQNIEESNREFNVRTKYNEDDLFELTDDVEYFSDMYNGKDNKKDYDDSE